ncbi:MAG: hypothetical protein P1U83_06085 [Roseovarius sp.]|nr:hypothetical protein [Roseovarius sp.]
MKSHIKIAVTASTLLLTMACTVEQTSTGTITVDGHSFDYERTISEQPTPYIGASSDGVYYKIAFPDGTTKTVVEDNQGDALVSARATIKQWLDSRETKDMILKKKAKAAKNTAQPKSGTETEKISPEPGGM